MKSILGRIAVLLVCLLAIEAALFAARQVSFRVDRALTAPWEQTPPKIPDALLGTRGNPFFHEHDERGYRNDRVLERADVVTLGDSHTYGSSVPPDAAWPMQYAEQSGRTVYNMAMRGYAPAQSLAQLDEAFALEPQQIFVSVYFGNDFFDSFLAARRRKEIAALVPPELLAETQALEAERPIAHDIVELFRPDRAAQGEATSNTPGWKDWIKAHSNLYGLARGIRYALENRNEPSLLAPKFEDAVKALSPAKQQHTSVFDGGDWRTILTAPYRSRALERGDPRIQAGLAVIRGSLAAIAQRCEERGVGFLVVLLPTKESVFLPRIADPALHPKLLEVTRDETALRENLMKFLEERSIAQLDMLPALRESDAQTYFENGNGHPNPLGHRIIASHVARRASALTQAPHLADGTDH